MIEVLFEDNHLLVLNKPAGLLTQPTSANADSLENQAKDWIKEKYQKPGNVFLEAAHRLDRPVSGVVVFGRTSKAVARLNASIREKETAKFYYALVDGCPRVEKGVLEHYLIHDDYQAQIVTKNHPGAKLAILYYRVIERRKGSSLLEIELNTGRYHQIRFQLSAIGCPIIGDHKYGSRKDFEPGAIALHHIRMQIPHPTTKALLTFEAPLPLSFNI